MAYLWTEEQERNERDLVLSRLESRIEGLVNKLKDDGLTDAQHTQALYDLAAANHMRETLGKVRKE